MFVEIASRHGWDAWGLEPSHWAVSEARKQGLQMIEGTLDSVDLPEAVHDVVTLWDVIEHVTDPFAEIRHAHRLLKPGGLLAMHTMDIDSLFARVMRPLAVADGDAHLLLLTPHADGDAGESGLQRDPRRRGAICGWGTSPRGWADSWDAELAGRSADYLICCM